MALKYLGGRQQLSLRMRLFNNETGIWAPGWLAVGGHTAVTPQAATPTTVSLMNYTLDDDFALNEVRASQTTVEMSNVMQIQLDDPTAFTGALARNGLLESHSVAAGAQVGLERLAPGPYEYLSVDLYHRNVTDIVVTRENGSTATAWQATTAYTLGVYKVPSTANGHFYSVSTAGTTGGAEPTWPTDGGTVVDGTVTWQDMGTIIATETTDYVVNSAANGELVITGDTRLEAGETLLLNYSYAGHEFDLLRPNTRTDFYAAIKFNAMNTFRPTQRSAEYWPYCHVVGTTAPEKGLANNMTWGLTITANAPNLLTHPELPADWQQGEMAREIAWRV